MGTISLALAAMLLTAEINLERESRAIVHQTNAFRQEQGLKPLTTNAELRSAARYFADYMAETGEYGHEADGQTPAERAEEHGYEYCLVLENIGYRFRSRGFAKGELADSQTEGWQRSPHHRDNMLNPDVIHIGVAIAEDAEGGFYAVQLFGRPRAAQIEFDVANKSEETITYHLAAREFTLEPRFTRTHTLCVPAKLEIRLSDDDKRSHRPAAGDHFLISGESGSLSLEKR